MADTAAAIDELRTRIGRHGLYLFAFVLGIANVGFQWALQDVLKRGFWASLAGLFGISAFVWVAVAALCYILHTARDETSASGRDIAMASLVVLACMVPIRSAAAIATTLLAINALLSARPRSSLFRAAAIGLSALVALFWGAVLLAITGNALLYVDVALAGTFAGLDWEANQLHFAGGNPADPGGSFAVVSTCSSLHGMSVAVLAFVLVTQFYDLPMRRRTLLWGLVGVVGMVAVNITRLGIMGHYPAWFDWMHVGAGSTIAGGVSTAILLLANMGGNWRAITRSA